MSAQEPPTPEEMAAELPITAEEAESIADAMTPLQNLTDVGSSAGNVMEDLPGPGPKLAGTVLRNVSTQVNLASQSAELVARSIDFYVTAQGGAIEDLFPPPAALAMQLEQDFQTVSEAFPQPGGDGPPGPF